MAEQVKTKAVRTVPGGDIKPPWEVREMPAPPPKTFGSFMVWAGPAVVLGALSVGGFEAYQAGYVAAWNGPHSLGLHLFRHRVTSCERGRGSEHLRRGCAGTALARAQGGGVWAVEESGSRRTAPLTDRDRPS